MCEASTTQPHEAMATAPRPAAAPAVDPITLEPVDEVRITTLVDNVFDALLTGDEHISRAPFHVATAPAAQFESGSTYVGLTAEHGFSALVTVRRGTIETTLLFDTGMSPGAMVGNADRLGVDLSAVRAVVLSHGHFDHAGGLAGMAGKRGVRTLPMVVHPLIWTRRRLNLPGKDPVEMPTLSKGALTREGFEVIERRHPSLLVDGSVLITGEVDRTTEFEHGMPPPHEAWTGAEWRHDPLVIDDQALVVHVRGQGLVVLTGCGHAGVINIIRHAQRLTGVDQLHALVGGLHLGGPAFEPIIPPTVAELTALNPSLVVSGHCTGWRAQHALAAALPAAWAPGSSGSSYRLTGLGTTA
ncbi:MAG TPA: MBL fold metallo-hydrolase [Pseudonocardia sp.]|uniref:MBL fold metallo-hydrolase n=1 Tax=Pseudonocardia sp. TaxID=60912 RepID=UPI002ED87A0C